MPGSEVLPAGFRSSDRFLTLLGCSSDRDKMEDIVKDEIPAWIGLLDDLLTVKLDGTALFRIVRQYGDVQVKYGQTYGFPNACILKCSRALSIQWNFFS